MYDALFAQSGLSLERLKTFREIVGHTLRALEEFRGTCAGLPVELVIGAGFKATEVRGVPLTFLGTLSRQVSLVWSRRTAEVRPAIAKYSRLLPAIFRMEEW